IWQLIKWIKRKKAITRIEQKILEDLPKLHELANLTKTYLKNGPSDIENEEKDENNENQTFFQE
ncbi:MAG: hypothetical protein ACTSRX_00005, partial [Promethearchaeota archaeon]